LSALSAELKLTPLPPVAHGDDIEYSAMLELPGVKNEKLWFRVPARYSQFVDSQCCDPFVVGALFLAMEQRSNIAVSGRVSPSLIGNLVEFQNAWSCWLPNVYTRIEIKAESEEETPCSPERGRAEISAFTGGVDSTFTVYRHVLFIKDRQKRNIEAGLLVHGFDVPLSERVAFENVARKSREVLDSIGLPLITVSTNVRQLGSAINADASWNYTHGAALASVMLLFQRGFSTGLIPATYSVNQLHLPWGSNPITDRFLGTTHFKVVHDAPHWMRFGKIQALTNWPIGYDNLRVCYDEPYYGNCCRCLKCIMTLVLLKVAGAPLPSSFPEDVSEKTIFAMKDIPPHEQNGVEALANLLRSAGTFKILALALQRRVNSSRRRLRWTQSLAKFKAKLQGMPGIQG